MGFNLLQKPNEYPGLYTKNNVSMHDLNHSLPPLPRHKVFENSLVAVIINYDIDYDDLHVRPPFLSIRNVFGQFATNRLPLENKAE